MDRPPTSTRHYGMDWLRIGAFQLLILYHVGMAFVRWDYQVKVSPPVDWAAIPMFLTNPWRLSLLFVVSGYASAALLAKAAGPGAFVRSRLGRLGLPLLFGMAVIVTPQPWVWLVTHFGYSHGFGWFIVHDYYRFQSIHGVAMPTWMHLWFVVYLLAYTLLLGALLTLPASWREGVVRISERVLASPALLPLGIAWAYAARACLSPGFEDNHMLWGDWSAHATYLPAFLFGLLLRHSARLHETIARWRKPAAAVAVTGWLVLAGFELLWPGDIAPPHELRWLLRPLHGIARSAEAWGAIVALIGIADRYWDRDSKWRPMLAEAVFPFYLVHQTIILVVGYWLLSTATTGLERFLILVVGTAGGCWLFYLAGREVGWLRPLIGLRRRPAQSAANAVTAARIERKSALSASA